VASYSGLGQYHSRILDRWAANTGRLEGATAEEAVPFPYAARRSFILRLVAFLWVFLPMLTSCRTVGIKSLRAIADIGGLWICPAWHNSTGKARRAVLITALCAAAPLAHAQQFPSIESLNESYAACVQSAFVRRLEDFGASNLPQATERAFIDCQLEEDALYTTAVASAPGNTQAIALARAAIEQLKAKLKAELLAAPPTMPPKE